MKIISTKLTQHVRMKQVGDAVAQNDPVARERAEGRPKHNKAQCRARARSKTRIKQKVAHAREGKNPTKTLKLNVPKIVPNTIMINYFLYLQILTI